MELFASSGFLVELTLIVHAGATWAMAGVILIVQFVHYPLFASVGVEHFAAYEASHTRRITWVVAPLMILELASAIALVPLRPASVAPGLLWVGLSLVVILWISTVAVQVPLHKTLARGFDAPAHRRLLSTNWLRTLGWLVRSIIAGIILLQHFNP